MTEIAQRTESVVASSGGARSRYQSDAFTKHLRRRYASERRFKIAGVAAIAFAAAMLVVLLGSIVMDGWSAFRQTEIVLPVELTASVIDPQGGRDPQVLMEANYTSLIRDSAVKAVPGVDPRSARRPIGDLFSNSAAYDVRDYVMAHPGDIGKTVTFRFLASDDADQYVKGFVGAHLKENERRVNDAQVAALKTFQDSGMLSLGFNTTLFTSGDSREPEQAGIWGAIVGSFLTLIITMSLSVPIGIAAAIYLEEFAPKNGWTDLIEVNINNLAAVPSIVFGLLGLAVFLNVFGLPRSAPLVGGLVMALMTLPVIIIAGRVAIKSVPPSIREAALGVGASPLQAVLHHVLPLAMPGILTGTIIGMARALGETAPLLMIGMVAFIVDIPKGFTDSASVLPVQIYMWSDSPERAFTERTSAAIMVLLGFLILMNGLAVFLRKKFERRW